MFCRRNVLSTKCSVDKSLSTKRYFDKVSCRRNVCRRKIFDKMCFKFSCRRNACRRKCQSTINMGFMKYSKQFYFRYAKRKNQVDAFSNFLTRFGRARAGPGDSMRPEDPIGSALDFIGIRSLMDLLECLSRMFAF